MRGLQRSRRDGDPRPPRRLTPTTWRYVLGRTRTEFGQDQCTDLAAALTYYSVLSVFPALLALVALLGVVGDGPRTVTALFDLAGELGIASVVDALQGPITELTASRAAGLALATGLAGALWSASGYVGAFGRALNRVYGVEEGRPVWKLRPLQIVITAVLLVMAALVAVALVVSGPLARSLGARVGLGDAAVTAWGWAKWPVMLLTVALMIALLYNLTPNVRQPRFRLISPGAVVAILVWVVASAGFGYYVGNFGSYNKTYGSLTGVIVFLLWLWLTNVALIFGAELNAEIERGRQLQAGIEAEQQVQLRPRDAKGSAKKVAQRERVVRRGRELRLSYRRHPGQTEG